MTNLEHMTDDDLDVAVKHCEAKVRRNFLKGNMSQQKLWQQSLERALAEQQRRFRR